MALPASSIYSYLAAAAANQDSQNVKAGPAQLCGYALFNPSGAGRYVKLYDKATAPTSADTPAVRIFLPSGGGANMTFEGAQGAGPGFANGLGLRITTGAADNDTGAATANDVLVNLFYR